MTLTNGPWYTGVRKCPRILGVAGVPLTHLQCSRLYVGEPRRLGRWLAGPPRNLTRTITRIRFGIGVGVFAVVRVRVGFGACIGRCAGRLRCDAFLFLFGFGVGFWFVGLAFVSVGVDADDRHFGQSSRGNRSAATTTR